MNADEIVKALRDCAQDLLDVKGGTRKSAYVMVEASSLIENLQTQLAIHQRSVIALAVESLEREKTLAKLEAEVMQLWEAQRWRDTEYDTPDIGQAVLLYMPDKETDNIRAGEYLGEGDYRIGNKLYRGMEIAAWLPLPAAPEEAK
jgi:hypothetical protein